MKNIYMIVLSFLCLSAMGQTLTIKDQNTNEPLEWVAIMSEVPAAFAQTNLKGQADIKAFTAAEYIQISALGYESVAFSFQQLAEMNFKVLLSPAKLHLEDVVISATRWRQSSADIPARVSNISNKEVQLIASQTTADLLALSGKVFIQKSQQGGGSPMIRGFATNRLLYAVDGVRMNTAIFRGGNLQNVISLDPFALEHTEILFGPGSVMFGSDAIGGVMSFQTLMPELSISNQPLVFGNVQVRSASANNEQTGHFDFNAGWKKWALVTSVSSFKYDHLRQGSHGPKDYLKPFYVERRDSLDQVVSQSDPLLQIPSGYSQINFMQKIRYRASDQLDFQYAMHFSETSPYGRYDRHTRLRNRLPRYARWDYGPQIWQMHHFQTTYNSSNAVFDQAIVRLARQYFEESRIDRALNKNTETTNLEKVFATSINLDLIKKMGDRHSITYGAEYVLNDVESTGYVVDISTSDKESAAARYPKASWTSVGLFANDQFQILPKLMVQTGVRYNQFIIDATFDPTFYNLPFTMANINKGAVTGSLGMVWRPAASTVINTNLATAFRAPNVDDLGKIFDSGDGFVTVPNPNLEAEYAYNFDLGMAHIFNEAVKLDISVYYTYLNNALVRRNFQLNGQDSILYDGVMSKVQAIQNAANAKVYGIQASLEWALGAGFDFATSINIQKGEEELDDATLSASRHAAPAFGVTKLTYTHQKITIQAYANYQAKRDFEDLAFEEQSKTEIYALNADGNPYCPFWYTLNLKAKYNLQEWLSFTAGIENITDQRYRPYSSGISGAGKNFTLALKASF